MAEPPATTLKRAAASRPDELLATKLYLPRPHPGYVPRPRLAEQLTEATARELTVVCAPAGFGKTALLADWSRRSQRPVAWLSLDTGDNDPARFWRHVAAALDQVRPGIAERVVPLLGPRAAASFDGLVAALINQLAERPEQVLLILDDYHLIETQPAHTSLAFLVEHLPPGLRLLLASRADPPLPLARLRARGQLGELRATDLRFTAGEAAALLRQAIGSDLPEAAVAALAARTEGWAAGLQLAALSLRGRGDVAAFIKGFSGSHRYVLDYLAEEVLDRQPERLRTFLLETSVLERLSGPLCKAVTGQADSQQLLEQVERANLFLVPLDEVRGWWRYHHLFADLLRARLAEEQPDRLPALHQAAAAWSEEHGLVDDAIRHALAAGDAAWAARLIEYHADAVFRRAEDATLAQWLAGLPAELVHRRPRLCLALALRALIDGRLEAADSLLDDAERALAAIDDEPWAPSVGRAASLVANVPAAIAVLRARLARLHGDAERTIEFGQQALAHLTDTDRTLRSMLAWYLAVADWLRGRVAEAEHALTGLVAAQRAAGERYLAMWPQYELGQVQLARGRLTSALRNYRQALEVASDPGGALPPAGIGHVGMAEVLYERSELDTALHHAGEGIGLCRQLAYALPLAIGLAVLARIRLALGDRAGALEAISEAERVMPAQDLTLLLNPVPAMHARLLLTQGDLGAAVHWTQQRGLGANDQPSYPKEPELLVLARVLLAQDRPDQALGLLQRLHEVAAAQGRTGSIIEIQALRALALAAADDESAAVATLAEALALAQPEGYVRVFADEGAPMGALLGRLVAAQRTKQTTTQSVPIGYLGRLVRAFGQDRAVAGPQARLSTAAVPGLVEALSERELQVLRLLAAGKPNREIAEELVVAVNTVKKHVTRVFDKLGAANRTEATARARELGLLP